MVVRLGITVPTDGALAGSTVLAWRVLGRGVVGACTTRGSISRDATSGGHHRRGRSEGRVSTLVRLRPEVVKEIKCLVDGPLYLTIELALRHYAKDLRARAPGSVEMIKAADLE